MRNYTKKDKLFMNVISPPDDVENIYKNSVGIASKDPFCIYNHQRHGVGSVIKNRDGSETVCTEDGSWQHS